MNHFLRNSSKHGVQRIQTAIYADLFQRCYWRRKWTINKRLFMSIITRIRKLILIPLILVELFHTSSQTKAFLDCMYEIKLFVFWQLIIMSWIYSAGAQKCSRTNSWHFICFWMAKKQWFIFIGSITCEIPTDGHGKDTFRLADVCKFNHNK